MKILALGLRGFPGVMGGVETCCENLYPHVAAAGHEVLVISRSCYTGKKGYRHLGVRIIPVWALRFKNFEAFLHTLIALLMALKYRPDIIHFHAIGPSFFVPFARLMGFKVVATHHGFDYDRSKWGWLAKKILKWGERNLCRADAVVCIAGYIQESLKKRFGCDSHLIANGTVLKDILPCGEQCGKYNLTSKRYFLFAGRFVPEKNIHQLLEAFGKMETDWKLVIAGDADHETEYSRMVKAKALQNTKVVLTGFIKGEVLQEIFSNAGCMIIPSSHEGFPIILLEGLSYDLPCIVSDIPAHREVEFETIRHFPLNDMEKLKALMLEAAGAPGHTDTARKYIEENYNWRDIAGKYLKIFGNIYK